MPQNPPKLKLPATLRPESLTAIVDSREQRPLNLAPLMIETGTLPTGDYSLRGLEHVVAIERKSLPDLIACVGVERERFDRQVQRLLAHPVRILLVEANWADIRGRELEGQDRARGRPGRIALGLQVEMAGDHARTGKFVSRILYTVARHRYRELRALVPSDGGDA